METVALIGVLVLFTQEPPMPGDGDEALRATRDPAPGSFSVAPAVGFLNSRGADSGTWFGGVQARLHLGPVLALEGSATFHRNEYSDGDIVVTQYPVQATVLLYPLGAGSLRPYALAGAGWYYTRTRYDGLPDLLFDDQVEHEFGAHVGAGVEAVLGPRLTLDGDVRYIFLDPSVDGVRGRDFDYWQVTAGLNLRL